MGSKQGKESIAIVLKSRNGNVQPENLSNNVSERMPWTYGPLESDPRWHPDVPTVDILPG